MPAAERVRGRDGRSLAEVWNGSPQAYLGTTVAGFPNLFLLVGPNTGLGHNSIVFMIESQIATTCSTRCASWSGRGAAALEVRPEAQARYNARVQDADAGHGVDAGGCASWYLDANGRNTTLWPSFTWPFRERTRRLDRAHYELRAPRPAREPVAA